MRSLDTNVVVRILLQDDDKQTGIARRLLAEPCFVTSSVVLEAFWVLTSVAHRPKSEAAAVLMELLDVPALMVPDVAAVRWALGKVAAGADFADMLHLALSAQAASFATFDQRLARHAGGAPVPVETLG